MLLCLLTNSLFHSFDESFTGLVLFDCSADHTFVERRDSYSFGFGVDFHDAFDGRDDVVQSLVV